MNDRTAHCMLLVKVLTADGMIAPIEREFLEKAMQRLGLSAEERERIISLDGWDEAEPVIAALPPGRRRAIVEELVEATLVDGKLSPHELKVVERISKALEAG